MLKKNVFWSYLIISQTILNCRVNGVCSPGKHANQSPQTNCKDCPTGTYQDLNGQAYCKTCATGTYQDQVGQSSCEPCPSGKYRGGIGASSLTQCIICSGGKYQDEIGQTTCKLCVPGRYQEQVAQSSCKSCPSGKYYPGQGSSDPNCYPCSVGTTSDEGASTCTPNLKNCPAGQYEYVTLSPTSRQCRNMTNHTCAIGKRFESASATDSILFTGATTDDATCIPCRPGKFKSTNFPTSCTVCAPGSYQNLPGSSLCTLCPPGKTLVTAATADYHDALSDCEDCAVGQYSPVVGHAEECYLCLTAKTLGSSVCEGCGRGKFKDKNTDECKKCESGYFSIKQNVGACSKCPMGYFANHQVLDGDTQARYDRCQACPRGTFGIATGANNASEGCSNCISGTYSEVTGIDNGNLCKGCPQGK
jgi:hypothetical protein